MAHPFKPKKSQLAHDFTAFARIAVLWSLLGLGLAGGGAAFVWLVTSPDNIDAKILRLTGRGSP